MLQPSTGGRSPKTATAAGECSSLRAWRRGKSDAPGELARLRRPATGRVRGVGRSGQAGGASWRIASLRGAALHQEIDGVFLAESPLCQMPGVKELAESEYRQGGYFRNVLALREVLAEAVTRTRAVLPPIQDQFLTLYAEGIPIAKIARKIGRTRTYLSASIRPWVVKAVTREFLDLANCTVLGRPVERASSGRRPDSHGRDSRA